MDEIEFEQLALVNYLLEIKPGPVIQKIAEDRIRELEKIKYISGFESKNIGKRCYHKPTLTIFSNLGEAAKFLKARERRISTDIRFNNSEKYQIILF